MLWPGERGFLVPEAFPMGLGRKRSWERRLPLGLFTTTYSIPLLWVQITRSSCNVSDTCPGPDPIYLHSWVGVTDILGSCWSLSDTRCELTEGRTLSAIYLDTIIGKCLPV